jgi:hypothetical protein
VPACLICSCSSNTKGPTSSCLTARHGWHAWLCTNCSWHRLTQWLSNGSTCFCVTACNHSYNSKYM